MLDSLPLIPFQTFLVEISSYMMLFIQSDSQRKKKMDSIWTVLSTFCEYCKFAKGHMPCHLLASTCMVLSFST